ncbi:DUF2178 domain-containing protein [Thermococcus sp. 5-4]|uniref:DUF2178 domain-containing protein n=1 Tax=Thermococcus sp. 5-4 TaxID=2008440 RepID=UPI000B49CE80|nr:DUF2178 domain-containing protein [Thermococcus sp. 5-4]ASA78040.1 hypothetical protein CDI07_06920 [Thermococcus sp. 5-4]
MEWDILIGVLVGMAVGISLPLVYRRNVGHDLDERAERIEEKAALRILNVVQITSGLEMVYLAFITGEANNLAFAFLSLTFFIATFGHLLLKVYYSRVM